MGLPQLSPATRCAQHQAGEGTLKMPRVQSEMPKFSSETPEFIRDPEYNQMLRV